MGYYAELQWRAEFSRGRKESLSTKTLRNEVTVSCMFCGAGIRHIKGDSKESLEQHLKSKKCHLNPNKTAGGKL
jgi:hypothetical protein